MQTTSPQFKANARAALKDTTLRQALGLARVGFSEKRRAAVERLPEFEGLRDEAKALKEHTLAHLDFYLEEFEKQVMASSTNSAPTRRRSAGGRAAGVGRRRAVVDVITTAKIGGIDHVVYDVASMIFMSNRNEAIPAS